MAERGVADNSENEKRATSRKSLSFTAAVLSGMVTLAVGGLGAVIGAGLICPR